MIIGNLSLNFIIKYYIPLSFFIIFFHGELTMIIMGILTARFQGMSIVNLCIVSCFSAIINEEIFFLASRFLKDKKLHFIEKHKHNFVYKKIVSQSELHAALIFALCRFLPGLRILSAVALGQMTISIVHFSLVNIILSSTWALSFCLLGRYIGIKNKDLNLETVTDIVSTKFAKYKLLLIIISASLLIGIALYFVIKKIKKHHRGH